MENIDIAIKDLDRIIAIRQFDIAIESLREQFLDKLNKDREGAMLLVRSIV